MGDGSDTGRRPSAGGERFRHQRPGDHARDERQQSGDMDGPHQTEPSCPHPTHVRMVRLHVPQASGPSRRHTRCRRQLRPASAPQFDADCRHPRTTPCTRPEARIAQRRRSRVARRHTQDRDENGNRRRDPRLRGFGNPRASPRSGCGSIPSLKRSGSHSEPHRKLTPRAQGSRRDQSVSHAESGVPRTAVAKDGCDPERNRTGLIGLESCGLPVRRANELTR